MAGSERRMGKRAKRGDRKTEDTIDCNKGRRTKEQRRKYMIVRRNGRTRE